MIDSMQDKKRNFLGIIITAVLIILFSLGQSYFSKKPSIDKQLAAVASEMNKTLPVMIDSLTRLDNIIALPDKILLYNYTVMVDSLNVDYSILKANMKALHVNNMKTHPSMKRFRDDKVNMNYSYKNRTGNFLFKFEIGPEDYM